MNNKNLVFVYGTLRKHEKYHHLLEGAECKANQAWTNGKLFDTEKGYPALKKSDHEIVYGELYAINDEVLQKLDELEDYFGPNQNNVYDRKIQTVYTDIGPYEAYVYLIHPEHENLLKHGIDLGDWRVYHLLKSYETFAYFAYGSCLDQERFKISKVDHYFQKLLGVGILDGYELRYTRVVSDGGRADVVEEGGVVEGKVYEVPKACIAYLFRREGVYVRAYRPAFIDVKINGRLVKNVLTFLVVHKDKEVAPPYDYANEIIRGGNGYLSDAYMEKVKQQLRDRFNMSV